MDHVWGVCFVHSDLTIFVKLFAIQGLKNDH